MPIEFEWDDDKTAANLAKHRVDFIDAAQIFAGPTVQLIDEREDYGEQRVRAIGEHDGRIYVVVYTIRQSRLRLISAWKAGKNDREKYYARIT